MADLIAFPINQKSQESPEQWLCKECERDTLRLYCDGIVYCPDCNLELTNIIVIETDSNN